MPQYDDNEINDYVIMRLKNYFGEEYEIHKDRFIQIYLEAEKKGKGQDFIEELAEAVYHQKNSTYQKPDGKFKNRRSQCSA